MMKVMNNMAKGRYLESKVMMKNETWRVGFSWAKVYAYASDRAGKNVYVFNKAPAVAFRHVSAQFHHAGERISGATATGM